MYCLNVGATIAMTFAVWDKKVKDNIKKYLHKLGFTSDNRYDQNTFTYFLFNFNEKKGVFTNFKVIQFTLETKQKD